ncbi:hypothetical protein AB5J62_28150 [Amycolatopsis sp. cg5]|uniref:hypothetical protein n=1 Tax=Amycolatopsis sp. cg5 TaxID=3238802 RepID=UPI0035246EA2
MRLLVVLTALAVLAAGWFGWSWWSAAHDDGVSLARDRDAVLSAASTELVVLNTIDHRTAAADVDKWIAATTGRLGKDLADDRQVQVDRAASTQAVASAVLKQAAVTEVNPAAGTARVIAVLDVLVGTGGAAPAPNVSRLNVDLERTTAGWKVSAIQAAAK